MKISITIILKVILILLFLGCLLDMPYVYFSFVRITGMTVFAIFAYQDWQKQNKMFTIIWVCSMIIVNPIIKIPLGRTLWNVVDVIWVIILIISIFKSPESLNKEI